MPEEMCAGGMLLPEWKMLPDIGLYMDQVMTLMERTFARGEITKSMVNNYVKAGMIKRPAGKRYDREQLAQLVMIGVLKQALSMEDIGRVLDVLCAEGMQAGYARFCEAAYAVSDAIGTGGMIPAQRAFSQTAQDRAAYAAITAAVCAAHAHSLLGADAEK